MPGEASLRQRQYYAHPRNAFWPIMSVLTGVAETASYEERVAGLSARGIAVWDVLQSCERPGSLDASIREHTIAPNDFSLFFRRHPRLSLICFNGTKAEQCFRRYVLPGLVHAGSGLAFERLPSTSPAHASRSLEEKRAIWHAVLAPVLDVR